MSLSPASRWTAAAIAAAALAPVTASRAEPTTDELQQEIDELSQKVLVLELVGNARTGRILTRRFPWPSRS
jgi:hypothetical protein